MTVVVFEMNTEQLRRLRKLACMKDLSKKTALVYAFKTGVYEMAQSLMFLSEMTGSDMVLGKICSNLKKIRRDVSELETKYAGTKFDAFETFRDIKNLSISCCGLQAEARYMKRLLKERDITVDYVIDIPGFEKILDTYLL